jgi:hypothetical protein
MTSIQFPKLMPEAYRWQKSKTHPQTIQRRAIGTEAWVGIKDENFKGQYDNFLNATLKVQKEQAASPLSLASLKTAIAAALVELRFEHPESAGTAIWDEQGPFLQYTPPENDQQALAWAEAAIELWPTTQTGLGVRKEIGRRRKVAGSTFSGHAKSLTVHVIADVPADETQLASGAVIDILLHMNHIYWDGISARMFLGKLLQKIGTNAGDKQKLAKLPWGDEIKNISAPILDASKVDVSTLGEDFEEARGEFVQGLLDFAVRFAQSAMYFPTNLNDHRTAGLWI